MWVSEREREKAFQCAALFIYISTYTNDHSIKLILCICLSYPCVKINSRKNKYFPNNQWICYRLTSMDRYRMRTISLFSESIKKATLILVLDLELVLTAWLLIVEKYKIRFRYLGYYTAYFRVLFHENWGSPAVWLSPTIIFEFSCMKFIGTITGSDCQIKGI